MKFLSSFSLMIITLIICIDHNDAARIRRAEKCGKNEINQMDKLLTGVLPFSNPKSLPEKVEEIPQFCLQYGDSLTKIESLNKRCMQETQRNVIALIIYNIKQSTRGICSKKAVQSNKLTPAKKNFLQLTHCVNGGKQQLQKCTDTGAGYLTAIEKEPKTQRIPMLCCQMLNTRECYHKALRSAPDCKSDEVDKTLNDIVKSIGNGAESPLRSICGEYNDKAKCSKVKLPPIQKAKNQKSLIESALHLLEDL